VVTHEYNGWELTNDAICPFWTGSGTFPQILGSRSLDSGGDGMGWGLIHTSHHHYIIIIMSFLLFSLVCVCVYVDGWMGWMDDNGPPEG